jgi:hypothetical protein
MHTWLEQNTCSQLPPTPVAFQNAFFGLFPHLVHYQLSPDELHQLYCGLAKHLIAWVKALIKKQFPHRFRGKASPFQYVIEFF